MLTQADLALSDEIAKFYADPLGFVYFAFPWGEPGPLEHFDGPDVWQASVLTDIGKMVAERGFDGLHAVDPIKLAVSSGHGIGKGTISAWIACWILSTRPNSQGTITANSFPQLSTKTWATLQTWLRRCITGHWFDIGMDKIRHRAYPESWFVSAQTCREENSEAFAGQHAASSTSWYIFDEASAIPDVIFEVAEGGMTDGEPMMLMFGNPTRNTGAFHRACFGADRDDWHVRIIDSRDCKFGNKALFDRWIDKYGIDSDFVRVRVRGLPPAASDAQYIGNDIIWAAQGRIQVKPMDDEPLVAGLDVARGGGDNSVIRFRRGPDARTFTPIQIPAEESRDSMRLVSIAADVLDRTYEGRKVAMMFIDETGIGGPILDRLVQLGHGKRIMGVKFGGRCPDSKVENMRTYIWSKMREWLGRGCIEKSDSRLELDLAGPGYGHTKRDKLMLETKDSMKKRGLTSPDDGDALALTFAAPVADAKFVVTTPGYSAIASRVTGGLGWMAAPSLTDFAGGSYARNQEDDAGILEGYAPFRIEDWPGGSQQEAGDRHRAQRGTQGAQVIIDEEVEVASLILLVAVSSHSQGVYPWPAM